MHLIGTLLLLSFSVVDGTCWAELRGAGRYNSMRSVSTRCDDSNLLELAAETAIATRDQPRACENCYNVEDCLFVVFSVECGGGGQIL